MSVRRLAVIVLASGLLLAKARTGNASQNFPEAVQAEWQLPGDPPACTLCHQSLVGGFGTATKPFGRAVLRGGTTAVDANALRRALQALQASNSDVDHDGVSDYDELQTGTDPDVVDAVDADGAIEVGPIDDTPIPRTGCSVVAVGQRTRLTAPRPSPTVGPNSSSDAASRRFSDDAWLVCGLILGAVTVRLRTQRKRMASAAR